MTAFDPSDWLDRWEAAGGGWYVRDGAPVWCFLQEQERIVTALLAETHFRGRQDAVDAEMTKRHTEKEMQQPAE